LFYLLLALAFIKANAQTYQYVPFPTENAIWSEKYTSEEMQSPPWFYYYYDKIAMTNEDTSINGKTYKKLYLFNDSVFNINNATYIGGIREENKKIYYYGDTIRLFKPIPSSLSNEIVLYNFNINVNDTIYDDYFVNNNWATLVVDKIDTILLGNKLRRRIFFEYSNAVWIEGIGNLQGLLMTSLIITTKSKSGNPIGELICFKQNDTIIYFNNNYSECMPLNVPEKTVMKEDIVIAPNPAFLELKFSLPENITNATYALYDMQGISKFTGETTNAQTELNIASLPRGLYILKIVTDKQTITKKVVLQ